MNDSVLVEVYHSMLQGFQCSVDDVLETPELRENFLTSCRNILGEVPERDLLHRLVYLRKRSRLPCSRD